MNDPIESKPIVDVKNTLHTISRNINQLKTDIICIKSDISIIKDYINSQKKKEEEISKGWIW
jgi:archaellum component FlaC